MLPDGVQPGSVRDDLQGAAGSERRQREQRGDAAHTHPVSCPGASWEVEFWGLAVQSLNFIASLFAEFRIFVLSVKIFP